MPYEERDESAPSAPKPKSHYLGNLTEKTRRSGDRFLVGTLCLEDIESIPQEHIVRSRSGKRFVKIIISPYRDGKNQYGNTHSVKVDTYRPQVEPGNSAKSNNFDPREKEDF